MYVFSMPVITLQSVPLVYLKVHIVYSYENGVWTRVLAEATRFLRETASAAGGFGRSWSQRAAAPPISKQSSALISSHCCRLSYDHCYFSSIIRHRCDESDFVPHQTWLDKYGSIHSYIHPYIYIYTLSVWTSVMLFHKVQLDNTFSAPRFLGLFTGSFRPDASATQRPERFEWITKPKKGRRPYQ